MVGTIKGYLYVEYPDKKTGELKQGWELHLEIDPPKNKNYVGVICNNVWVPSVLMANTLGSPELDMRCNLVYDVFSKYPQLIDIVPVL